MQRLRALPLLPGQQPRTTHAPARLSHTLAAAAAACSLSLSLPHPALASSIEEYERLTSPDTTLEAGRGRGTPNAYAYKSDLFTDDAWQGAVAPASRDIGPPSTLPDDGVGDIGCRDVGATRVRASDRSARGAGGCVWGPVRRCETARSSGSARYKARLDCQPLSPTVRAQLCGQPALRGGVVADSEQQLLRRQGSLLAGGVVRAAQGSHDVTAHPAGTCMYVCMWAPLRVGRTHDLRPGPSFSEQGEGRGGVHPRGGARRRAADDDVTG